MSFLRNSNVRRNRSLQIESLENRELLSVNPLGIDNTTPAIYAGATAQNDSEQLTTTVHRDVKKTTTSTLAFTIGIGDVENWKSSADYATLTLRLNDRDFNGNYFGAHYETDSVYLNGQEITEQISWAYEPGSTLWSRRSFKVATSLLKANNVIKIEAYCPASWEVHCDWAEITLDSNAPTVEAELVDAVRDGQGKIAGALDGDAQVKLTWQKIAGATEYVIRHQAGTDGTEEEIGRIAASTISTNTIEFLDPTSRTSLSKDAKDKHYYTVEAVGNDGTSAISEKEGITAPINYAILFTGGGSAASNYSRYHDANVALYNTLASTVGLNKANIYVLESDGGENGNDQNIGTAKSPNLIDSDMTYCAGSTIRSATADNLLSTLRNIGREITKYDHLLFYSFDHGSFEPFVEGFWQNPVPSNEIAGAQPQYLNGWDSDISDTVLRKMFATYITKGYVTLSMAQCFSGGMTEEFVNRAGVQNSNLPSTSHYYVMAAAMKYELSWGSGFAQAFNLSLAANWNGSDVTSIFDRTLANYSFHGTGVSPYSDDSTDLFDIVPTQKQIDEGWHYGDDNTEYPWAAGENFHLFALGSSSNPASERNIASAAASTITDIGGIMAADITSDAKPDLSVYYDVPFYLPIISLFSDLENSFNATSFFVGENISCHYTFANNGSVAVPETFTNRITINGPNGYTQSYDSVVAGIAADRLYNLTDRINLGVLSAGTYTIVLELDVNGVVSELSKENNTYSLMFEVRNETYPVVPPNFEVTSQTDNSTTLTWETQDNATSYSLQYMAVDGSDSDWQTWSYPATTATTATITGLSADTPYSFRLIASNDKGEATASAFTRTDSKPNIQFTGSNSSSGQDINSDGKYDNIKFTLGVFCNVAGTYRLSAQMYDGNGNFVGNVDHLFDIPTWNSSISFYVDCGYLGEEQLAGSYTLTSIVLRDDYGQEFLSADYTTPNAYALDQFTPLVVTEPGDVDTSIYVDGAVTDQIVDNSWGYGYPNLDITVPVFITTGGSYDIEAALRDGNGTVIATFTANHFLSGGETQNVVLSFSGQGIYESQVSGPYFVTGLTVSHHGSSGSTFYLENAYQTPAYLHTQFSDSAIAKPATPTGLVASAVTKDSLTLTWTAVDGVTYTLEISADGNTWSPVKSPNAAGTTITGLTAKTEYQFRLLATEDSLDSDYATLEATTLADTPPVVAGKPDGTGQTRAATMTFGVIADNRIEDKTRAAKTTGSKYTVKVYAWDAKKNAFSTKAKTITITSTAANTEDGKITYTVTGLKADTLYKITVQAKADPKTVYIQGTKYTKGTASNSAGKVITLDDDFRTWKVIPTASLAKSAVTQNTITLQVKNYLPATHSIGKSGKDVEVDTLLVTYTWGKTKAEKAQHLTPVTLTYDVVKKEWIADGLKSNVKVNFTKDGKIEIELLSPGTKYAVTAEFSNEKQGSEATVAKPSGKSVSTLKS